MPMVTRYGQLLVKMFVEFKKYSKDEIVSVLQSMQNVSLAEKLPESKAVVEKPITDLLVTKPWPEPR
jgi:hypothetical protein